MNIPYVSHNSARRVAASPQSAGLQFAASANPCARAKFVIQYSSHTPQEKFETGFLVGVSHNSINIDAFSTTRSADWHEYSAMTVAPRQHRAETPVRRRFSYRGVAYITGFASRPASAK
ncbi:MAG: hypothetical protein ABI240_14995 [Sphingomonas sp.]